MSEGRAGRAMSANATATAIACPRCGTFNTLRCADPWGYYTGPCAHLWQCLDGCESRYHDDGRPYTFDPANAMHCACCGESDRDPTRAPDYLAVLCDTCASGECQDCDGYTASVARTDTNPTASAYATDDGLTSMSADWSYYLSLTVEECRNV